MGRVTALSVTDPPYMLETHEIHGTSREVYEGAAAWAKLRISQGQKEQYRVEAPELGTLLWSADDVVAMAHLTSHKDNP